MNRTVSATLFLVFAASAACGSAQDEDLFGNDPPGTPTGGAAPSSGGSSSDASTAGGVGGSGGGTGGIVSADSGAGGGSTLPPGAGLVVCGQSRCNRELGEVCCIPPPPFLGTAEPQCSSDRSECDATWECDADNDCNGRSCCFVTTGGGLTPLKQGSQCREGCEGDARFACSHPDDCSEEEPICCGRLAEAQLGTQAPYERITCTSECPDSSYVLCNGQEDCAAGSGTCQQSNALYAGFTACF